MAKKKGRKKVHRFRSKKQWRWAFANKKPWARRWAHRTPGPPKVRYRRLPKSKHSRAKGNRKRRR